MIIHDFGQLRADVYEHFPDGWPWTVVGVFPTDPDDVHSWFNYTVGLGGAEMWTSCYSIEGRGMDNDLACTILNVIAGAWSMGIAALGDQVEVPLGIPGPDGEWVRDAASYWWIPTWRVPSRTKQVFVPGTASWTVPLLWSSPLGWPEDGRG